MEKKVIFRLIEMEDYYTATLIYSGGNKKSISSENVDIDFLCQQRLADPPIESIEITFARKKVLPLERMQKFISGLLEKAEWMPFVYLNMEYIRIVQEAPLDPLSDDYNEMMLEGNNPDMMELYEENYAQVERHPASQILSREQSFDTGLRDATMIYLYKICRLLRVSVNEFIFPDRIMSDVYLLSPANEANPGNPKWLKKFYELEKKHLSILRYKEVTIEEEKSKKEKEKQQLLDRVSRIDSEVETNTKLRLERKRLEDIKETVELINFKTNKTSIQSGQSCSIL